MRDRQTRQPTREKRERQNLSEERAGKGFYPLHVESQLPSDNRVDNNDDSWPVIIGCVLVSKQDANEE